MSDVDDPVERLLRELGSEELEPTVVRIERAVATGRRRARRRRLASVGGVGIAVVAVVAAIGVPAAEVRKSPAPHAAALPAGTHRSATPSPTRPESPPAVADCTGQRLTLPPGATSGVVTGADPTGRYLTGVVFGHNLEYGTVLWTDGSPKLIDAPADDEAITVNSSGEVAGSGLEVHGNVDEQVGWTYRDGKVTRLGDADHSYRVYAINESGDLLVQRTSRNLDHITGISTTPMVLQVLGHDGSVRQLTGPGTDSLRFTGGIDDDGTVVGGSDDGGSATVWHPDGTSEQLKGDGKSTFANRVRDGWVLGASGDTDPELPGNFPVVRWDLRAGTVTSAKLSQPAGGINQYGWLAGASGNRPAIEEDGRVIPLPLPAGTTGGAGSVAATISDDGHTIGGQANQPNANIVPIRWLCH